MRSMALEAWLIVSCCMPAALASNLSVAEAVPHLDSSGRDGYRAFLEAGTHRAFVIAPGGSWAWKADGANAPTVLKAALQACHEQSGEICAPYATDDRIVFDTQQWPTLWGPYANSKDARNSRVGKARGERFFDLRFNSPTGKSITLSELRGRVLVLHFWASWCQPCQLEMPQLQRLHEALENGPEVQLVLLQVRENISTASKWMQRQHLSLPLHDSGMQDNNAKLLTLANGKKIADRDLATTFPTTYVLDKLGMVVFSHAGPLDGWPDYLPFLLDVVAKSGR